MADLRDVRTVFMGTPTFAVLSLEALSSAGVPLVGVITKPDQPSGRGRGVLPSAVGRRARELGIPLFKPPDLKKEENRRFLRDLQPDLIVVVAYGKMLPRDVLNLPRFGAVNVHFSLLPRWRGPSPVPAAILAGDTETGVTIMKLDEGMDTGPVLTAELVPIGPDDTTAALLPRLADLGVRLLIPALAQYVAGTVSPIPQNETHATICPLLWKGDGLIDWTRPAEEIARLIRAYDPWPGAYTSWNGARLLVGRARALTPPWGRSARFGARPGSVIPYDDGVVVTTGKGVLELVTVQLEGKKSLVTKDFRNGFPHFPGSVLGL